MPSPTRERVGQPNGHGSPRETEGGRPQIKERRRRKAGARRAAGGSLLFLTLVITACTAANPLPSALPGGRPERAVIEGRLITIAARPDGQNVVESLALATGQRAVLWTTGPEVTDWRVSTAGERAAYRAAIRSPEAAESIEVRDLVEGAVPRVVALVDPAVERISGHAFAADGGAVLYARQAVDIDGAVALWLAGARPGDERRPDNDHLYRVLADDGATTAAMGLVAWSSTSGRAALREDAPDGGPVAGVRFSAADGAAKDAGRSPSPEQDAALAVAADASAVAWLPRDGGAVVVDDGAGSPRTVSPQDEGAWPAVPLFDPTGTRLAWQVNPADGGAPAWVRLIDVRGDRPPRDLRLAGEGLQPLAFAPDGAWLLLGVSAPGMLDPVRLVVADVETGDLMALAWPPPAGLWGATWVP